MPGKSHGHSPQGGKESDTTERLHFALLFLLPYPVLLKLLQSYLILCDFMDCSQPASMVCPDFPDGLDGKESACNVGDQGSIPGSGRSPGEGNGNPLQYSCLENLHGQTSLAGYVHGITKSWTKLSGYAHTQVVYAPGKLHSLASFIKRDV